MSRKENRPNLSEITSTGKVSDPNKSKLIRFLSHPTVVALGLLGSIASLIGIPLALYLSAKEYPQLTYYVHPVKAVIVKSGQTSKLKATYDEKLITTDITVAQVAIWNEGAKPIKRDTVLKPIVIHVEGDAPILEATIRTSGRDVTQLALNTDEIQQGRVSVFWNILEHKDGGIIQLIYAGSPNANIFVDGAIEGQRQIAQVKKASLMEEEEIYNPRKRRENKIIAIVSLIVSIPAVFIAIMAMIKLMSWSPSWKVIIPMMLLFLIVIGLAIFLVTSIYQQIMDVPIPPFDFK